MTENAKKHVLDVYLVKDKSVCNLVCTFVIDSVQLTKKKTLKFLSYCKMRQRPCMTLDRRRTATGMLIEGASGRKGC